MSVSASAENLSTETQSCDGGSMCLELALEGERLCKSGDCRAGVAFFQAAIRAGTDDMRTLSAIYSQLGNAYFYLCDYSRAMQYHKLDLSVARKMGDLMGEAKASGNLGNTLKVMGKFEEAIKCCKRHLEISRELQDELSEARALYNLGNVYHAQGKHLGRVGQNDPGHFPQEVRECLQQAVLYYEENLELTRRLGDRQAVGRACGNLGNTCYLLGDFVRAIRYHTERLQVARELGDKAAERRANSNLGNSHIFLGQFENAAEHYKRTLALAEELGDLGVEAQACYSLGNTYTLLREYRAAEEYHSRHLAAARALNDPVGEGRAAWALGNAHAALGNHEKALYYATEHYNISKQSGISKDQIFCYDIIASNTGHINGACVFLEQKFNRVVLIFACRHHIYELVLKGVFEAKISQVTNNSDIPLFKKFRDNWKNIDPKKIQSPSEMLSHLNVSENEKLLEFYRTELTKEIVRNNYRELIELSIIFLGRDTEKKYKIQPPGAMHQARWMARAIYSLKMSLLEAVDKTISKAALQKFCQHLWYLVDEGAVLSLFDDNVDQETKIKIVKNLSKENPPVYNKQYIPSKEDLCSLLYEKDINDFISNKSKTLFHRFKIDDSFPNDCFSSWPSNTSFLRVKEQMMTLRAVNDTAERAVKLMQDFHEKITVEEEQKQVLLRCVQEHGLIYPDCKKKTLKKIYKNWVRVHKYALEKLYFFGIIKNEPKLDGVASFNYGVPMATF
ncbi:G-protein-signaling modulator 2 [Eumeta japonica]|uniref:G-protein-signaling modulator 2 n=1 Tax=Eumeta variegata TaxID=151549 RepID=A0A4C1XYY0_EUMVA|nr:G-protein-signaling modulator 2 [Eumeta japonica]